MRLVSGLKLNIGNGIIGNGVEMDGAFAVLAAAECIVSAGPYVPVRYPVVVSRDVNQNFLVSVRRECISVKCASQSGRELRQDSVTVQENAVVSRSGALIVVAERRSKVLRINVTGNRKHRKMQQVPMPLVGMGKTVYEAILILISGTAPEHGHRARLNHRIRKGCAGESLRSPGPGLALSDIMQVGFLPQCGCAQERIHIVSQPGIAVRSGGYGDKSRQCSKDGD